jgi:hypothetical protein
MVNFPEIRPEREAGLRLPALDSEVLGSFTGGLSDDKIVCIDRAEPLVPARR